MTPTQQANRAAKSAADNSVVRGLGRGGLVAHGVVHLLLAYLAVQVAVGGSSEGKDADKTGALATLGQQPGGRFLLWAVAIGLVALAVWQAAEGIWGQRRFDGGKRVFKRVGNGAKAVLYGALGINAAKVATTGADGSAAKDRTFTARVLELPAGQVLVGAVGLAVLGVGGFLVYHGVTKRFTEDLDLSPASPGSRRATLRLGQVGYSAVGVAYGIVGVLVVVGAVTFNPDKASGLDAALKTLAAQPYGAVLLCAVAAGLAAFGIYRFFDARFHRE